MSTVQCVLQCSGLSDEATDSITSTERWENLIKALLWSGLDMFGDVPATVEWDKSPIGQCVHDACRLNLCNTKKLEHINKSKKKREVDECLSQSSSMSDTCSPATAPAAKRLRSSLGLIYDKTECVWCCQIQPKCKKKALLDFFQESHGGPGRSDNARKDRLCS